MKTFLIARYTTEIRVGYLRVEARNEESALEKAADLDDPEETEFEECVHREDFVRGEE